MKYVIERLTYHNRFVYLRRSRILGDHITINISPERFTACVRDLSPNPVTVLLDVIYVVSPGLIAVPPLPSQR
jgi:hypothetical protein